MMNYEEHTESVKSMRNRTTKLEREGDYWTAEEKERLTEMFHDGTGITAMAIRLQRTEPAVVQQIEKQNLYQRKVRPLRSKAEAKPAICLCDTCELDHRFCPRCNDDLTALEGE